MEESARLEKQKELIEYIGRLNEREGFQPVTGRILGMLMVMDKEEYTFEEIVEEMKISKSSASTALKFLEVRGVIEYITYPGDRKRYFRFKSGEVDEMISAFDRKLHESLEVINQIIELKKDKESRNTIFLKRIAMGMDFMCKKIEDLILEYEKRQ